MSRNITYVKDKTAAEIQEVGSDMALEACIDMIKALNESKEQNERLSFRYQEGVGELGPIFQTYVIRFQRLGLAFQEHSGRKDFAGILGSFVQAGLDTHRANQEFRNSRRRNTATQP